MSDKDAVSESPPESSSGTPWSHVLGEFGGMDELLTPIRSSARIKYTSLAVSKMYIALGSTTGAVYIFHRETLKYLQLLSTETEGPVTHVLFAPDNEICAYSTSKGYVVVMEMNIMRRSKPERLRLSLEHKNCMVTALQWNNYGTQLYIGDNTGKVTVANVSTLKAKDLIKQPTEVILRLDSAVVQIDFEDGKLLVSTLTRTHLCNTIRHNFTQIGTKLRDGKYGACFFHGPKIQNPSIYCARPGSRMWEVDFEGNVLNTHQFKQLLSVPSMPVVSTSHVDLPGFPLDLNGAPQSMNFPMLCMTSDQYLLTWSEKGLYIFDPANVKLVLWNDQFSELKDLKCYSNDIYLLHGTNQVSRLSVLEIEKCAMKLFVKQQYRLCAQLCLQFQMLITKSKARRYIPEAMLSDLKDNLVMSDMPDLAYKIEELSNNLELGPGDCAASTISSRRSSITSLESLKLESGIYVVNPKPKTDSDDDVQYSSKKSTKPSQTGSKHSLVDIDLTDGFVEDYHNETVPGVSSDIDGLSSDKKISMTNGAVDIHGDDVFDKADNVVAQNFLDSENAQISVSMASTTVSSDASFKDSVEKVNVSSPVLRKGGETSCAQNPDETFRTQDASQLNAANVTQTSSSGDKTETAELKRRPSSESLTSVGISTANSSRRGSLTSVSSADAVFLPPHPPVDQEPKVTKPDRKIRIKPKRKRASIAEIGSSPSGSKGGSRLQRTQSVGSFPLVRGTSVISKPKQQMSLDDEEVISFNSRDIPSPNLESVGSNSTQKSPTVSLDRLSQSSLPTDLSPHSKSPMSSKSPTPSLDNFSYSGSHSGSPCESPLSRSMEKAKPEPIQGIGAKPETSIHGGGGSPKTAFRDLRESISARGAKFSDRTKSLFKNIKEKIKKEIDSETDSRPSTPREIGQFQSATQDHQSKAGQEEDEPDENVAVVEIQPKYPTIDTSELVTATREAKAQLQHLNTIYNPLKTREVLEHWVVQLNMTLKALHGAIKSERQSQALKTEQSNFTPGKNKDNDRSGDDRIDSGGDKLDKIDDLCNDATTSIGDVETSSGNVETSSGNVETSSGNVETYSGSAETYSGDAETFNDNAKTPSCNAETSETSVCDSSKTSCADWIESVDDAKTANGDAKSTETSVGDMSKSSNGETSNSGTETSLDYANSEANSGVQPSSYNQAKDSDITEKPGVCINGWNETFKGIVKKEDENDKDTRIQRPGIVLTSNHDSGILQDICSDGNEDFESQTLCEVQTLPDMIVMDQKPSCDTQLANNETVQSKQQSDQEQIDDRTSNLSSVIYLKDPFHLSSSEHLEVSELTLMCFESRIHGNISSYVNPDCRDITVKTEGIENPHVNQHENNRNSEKLCDNSTCVCESVGTIHITETGYPCSKSDEQKNDSELGVFVKCYFHLLNSERVHKAWGTWDVYTRRQTWLAVVECLKELGQFDLVGCAISERNVNGSLDMLRSGILQDKRPVLGHIVRLYHISCNKTLEYCSEDQGIIKPVDILYMTRQHPKYQQRFVHYFNKYLEDKVDKARTSAIKTLCKDREVRQEWLQCLLYLGCDGHLDHLMCQCGMPRPNAHVLPQQHEGVINEILQSSSGDAGIKNTCRESGYWLGFLQLCCHADRSEAMEVIVQLRDARLLEMDNKLGFAPRSEEEWQFVLKLKEIQTYGNSDDHDHNQSAAENAYFCLRCGTNLNLLTENDRSRSITQKQYHKTFVLSWDNLARLMVKSIGSQRAIKLLRSINIPQGELSFGFFQNAVCATVVQKQQRLLVHHMLEKMDTYLWSKKPVHMTPQLMYAVEEEKRFIRKRQNREDARLNEALFAELSSQSSKVGHRLLEEPECHWGIQTQIASVCPCCDLPLSETISIAEPGVLVFDCGHTFHKHCLPEKVCITCQLQSTYKYEKEKNRMQNM